MEQPIITTCSRLRYREVRQLTRLASLLVLVPYACYVGRGFESLCGESGDELSDFDNIQ
jgi:hypothetical protein